MVCVTDSTGAIVNRVASSTDEANAGPAVVFCVRRDGVYHPLDPGVVSKPDKVAGLFNRQYDCPGLLAVDQGGRLWSHKPSPADIDALPTWQARYDTTQGWHVKAALERSYRGGTLDDAVKEMTAGKYRHIEVAPGVVEFAKKQYREMVGLHTDAAFPQTILIDFSTQVGGARETKRERMKIMRIVKFAAHLAICTKAQEVLLLHLPWDAYPAVLEALPGLRMHTFKAPPTTLAGYGGGDYAEPESTCLLKLSNGTAEGLWDLETGWDYPQGTCVSTPQASLFFPQRAWADGTWTPSTRTPWCWSSRSKHSACTTGRRTPRGCTCTWPGPSEGRGARCGALRAAGRPSEPRRRVHASLGARRRMPLSHPPNC